MMLGPAAQVPTMRSLILILTVLLTLSSLQSLGSWTHHLSHSTDQFARFFYTDRDGQAEGKAVQAVVRWKHRLAIATLVVISCTSVLSRAIFLDRKEEWLHFGISTLLLIQSLGLLAESDCVRRFSLGLKLACGCALAIVSSLADFDAESSVFQSSLVGTECGCQILVILLSLLLPRRPDVCRNGMVVDRELSTSFLGRLTFSWAEDVLQLVNGREIEVDELPELDYETRAHRLQESFNQSKRGAGSAPMWRILLRCHRSSIIWQLCLCLVQAVVSFTPHLSLLRILRLLEARSEGSENSRLLWPWVAALSLSIIVSSSIDNWLYWIAWNKISVRVNEQISITVFDKAMRLTGSQPSEAEESDKKNEDVKNRMQNTINLVAVDGQRIAEFATFSFHLFLSPLKLVIASVMLNNLLGWQSLLAGLSCLLILMPLITVCGRWYAAATHDLMRSRDGKMAALTEVLRGIRQIKFLAWETKWTQRIQSSRDSELQAQRRVFLASASTTSLYLLGPILLSIGSLGTYAVLNNGLAASVAFTAISILTSMAVSLGLMPELLSDLLDALVSIRRLDEFFAAPEKKSVLSPSNCISFKNACVCWPGQSSKESSPWVLTDLNLQFPPNRLSLIVGRTGTGKSLLLASMLGECEILSGKVTAPVSPEYEDIWATSPTTQWLIPSAVAYVAQLPWIEAATIKENILFGLPCHAERYHEVLFACALTKDLEILPDGEDTEVGPSGVNLSGGQKARIALARALYSRAGILILDDIFSAVDVHTAHHLYEHALTGRLARKRTRILATHQIGMCLSQTEYLVHLQDGAVGFARNMSELKNSGVLDSLLYQGNNGEVSDADRTPRKTVADRMQSSRFQTSRALLTQDKSLKRTRQFVQKEQGRTNMSVPGLFAQYIKASGSWRHWILLVLGYSASTSLSLGRNWWLRNWSQHDTGTPDVSNSIDPSLKLYLSLYVAIAACEWVVGSLRTYFVFIATLKASDALFQSCLTAVMQAPLQWLDTVPLGQILNRFAADFSILDSRLSFELTYMLQTGTDCLSIILAGLIGNPWLVVPIIPLALSCIFYARRYLTAAREIKRMENISRSPIYEQFNSSLSGLWTIRAFRRSDFYVEQMRCLVDRHARAFWHQWLLTRWLGIRMNVIGAVFAACVAALVTQQTIDAATAGFAISFTIQLSSAMTQCIRLYTSLELAMNAVDRVLEYNDIEPEVQDGIDPPAAWPTHGRLEVIDLTVRYAPDLPSVLTCLNFTVEGSQRIGIVGRTGAGKSSLALALFQFLEACEGRILIDGIDIAKVKLNQLRSRLAMIPQNPVLLSGTVRSNLDPFDEHEDSVLLGALALVHGLEENTGLLAPQLDALISEGGLNISQGQRQLICLARAMVSNSKILILDEATSAVDQATDAQIQRALRTRFGSDTTQLVIAHRLSTIVDFDRILVLDHGTAVEFGHPQELMKIQDGVFRGMVEQDAERETLIEIIAGTVRV